MRWIAIALLLMFVACTSQTVVQPVPQSQCKWPEIPTDTGCCRDMNENGICDTIDFASNISAIEQEEYEQSAIKAQETANRSGKYRQTIMNEIYANASAIKSYRFFYKGDDIVVTNGSVVRKLISYYPVGDREINGKRMKVSVNTVWLDLSANKAVAQCVPPTDLVRQGMGTPCDDFSGIDFDVPFDEFALKLPVEWLADFLYRTPYEALPGNHIGKLLATLYRFTDLKDANRKTNLWIDDSTDMPLRIEVWQGDILEAHYEYMDLYRI